MGVKPLVMLDPRRVLPPASTVLGPKVLGSKVLGSKVPGPKVLGPKVPGSDSKTHLKSRFCLQCHFVYIYIYIYMKQKGVMLIIKC